MVRYIQFQNHSYTERWLDRVVVNYMFLPDKLFALARPKSIQSAFPCKLELFLVMINKHSSPASHNNWITYVLSVLGKHSSL